MVSVANRKKAVTRPGVTVNGPEELNEDRLSAAGSNDASPPPSFLLWTHSLTTSGDREDKTWVPNTTQFYQSSPALTGRMVHSAAIITHTPRISFLFICVCPTLLYCNLNVFIIFYFPRTLIYCEIARDKITFQLHESYAPNIFSPISHFIYYGKVQCK